VVVAASGKALFRPLIKKTNQSLPPLYPPPPPKTHHPTPAACASLLSELRALGVTHLAVTSSVSLQHLPWDVSLETSLPAKVAPRLAFAVQKLAAIQRLAEGAAGAGAGAAAAGAKGWGAGVADSVEEIPKSMFNRAESFEARRGKQPQFAPFPTTSSECLLVCDCCGFGGLHFKPILDPNHPHQTPTNPTPTHRAVGSFPQTAQVRRLRAQLKAGSIDRPTYERLIDQQIALAVGIQEGLGIDVLVHGEAERTDMSEHFGGWG